MRSCEVRGIILGILSTSSLFTVWSGRKELLKITRREILEEEPEKHFPSYLFIFFTNMDILGLEEVLHFKNS